MPNISVTDINFVKKLVHFHIIKADLSIQKIVAKACSVPDSNLNAGRSEILQNNNQIYIDNGQLKIVAF